VNVIIVPVVRGRQMTRECIESALAQDIGDVWLYVIDNASTDGTGEYLRTLGVRTTLVSHMRPVSLHKVWNEALTLAFDSLRLPFALVVNNDVILRTDTYRHLRDDGGLFVTGVGVGTQDEMASCDPSSRSPHPSFSCFLMRRECWERLGEFDEGMYAFAGDGDYHLRMHAEGIEAYSIAVPFGHVGSATINLAEPEERDQLCKQADRDRAYFKSKWNCEIGSDEYYKRFSPTTHNVYRETGRLDGTKAT
jgi:glycosyltransferase involved in cell wall biosynthesis